MRAEELIKGKYYKTYNIYNEIFYFCFEKIQYNEIHSYNFFIAPDAKLPYHKLPDELCGIEYFENKISHEVDISEVVKYLPVGHPDRIRFRKQRIKNLLSIKNSI